MIPVQMKKPKRSKYNNIRCEMDGIKFASKAEMAYYGMLKLRVAAGEVKYFLRQTALHLPGNIRYVVDFVEFWADGTVHYVDVKGFSSALFRLKKKQVEALYPIVIETPKVGKVK